MQANSNQYPQTVQMENFQEMAGDAGLIGLLVQALRNSKTDASFVVRKKQKKAMLRLWVCLQNTSIFQYLSKLTVWKTINLHNKCRLW